MITAAVPNSCRTCSITHQLIRRVAGCSRRNHPFVYDERVAAGFPWAADQVAFVLGQMADETAAKVGVFRPICRDRN